MRAITHTNFALAYAGGVVAGGVGGARHGFDSGSRKWGFIFQRLSRFLVQIYIKWRVGAIDPYLLVGVEGWLVYNNLNPFGQLFVKPKSLVSRRRECGNQNEERGPFPFVIFLKYLFFMIF